MTDGFECERDEGRGKKKKQVLVNLPDCINPFEKCPPLQQVGYRKIVTTLFFTGGSSGYRAEASRGARENGLNFSGRDRLGLPLDLIFFFSSSSTLLSAGFGAILCPPMNFILFYFLRTKCL